MHEIESVYGLQF